MPGAWAAGGPALLSVLGSGMGEVSGPVSTEQRLDLQGCERPLSWGGNVFFSMWGEWSGTATGCYLTSPGGPGPYSSRR